MNRSIEESKNGEQDLGIDELLMQRNEEGDEINSSNAQASSSMASGAARQNKQSSSSAAKKPVGRPRMTSGEKADKKSGCHYRKIRHDAAVAAAEERKDVAVVAQPMVEAEPLSLYDQRCKYGVLSQMKANLESEKNEWMRAQ